MADDATENTTPDAAAETSDGSANTESPAPEAREQQDAEVRDPGKLLSAYEAEKAKRKEQDAALRDLRSELDAMKAKAEGKEAEHAAAVEAKRVQDEALAKANERIVSAELRAAAKGKVADDVLSDLALFIKPSTFEVGDDGSVDQDAIAQAITDLIKNRPSLAAQGSRFQGSADGGARNDATAPAQLTHAEMARMTPEQIDAAEKAGQFDRLLNRS